MTSLSKCRRGRLPRRRPVACSVWRCAVRLRSSERDDRFRRRDEFALHTLQNAMCDLSTMVCRGDTTQNSAAAPFCRNLVGNLCCLAFWCWPTRGWHQVSKRACRAGHGPPCPPSAVARFAVAEYRTLPASPDATVRPQTSCAWLLTSRQHLPWLTVVTPDTMTGACPCLSRRLPPASLLPRLHAQGGK